jgi:hypothetical protein
VSLAVPATKTFEIQNRGNVLLTINKAKAPFGAFTTSLPVSEGQQITPDQSVVQSVTFQPKHKGTTRATYLVSTNDGTGAHLEQLVGIDDQLTDRYIRDRALPALLGGPHGYTTHIKGGYSRKFIKGRMYWSKAAGVHELHGPILARFRAIGGPIGPAGFPTTDVTTIPGGQRARLGGSWKIYWSAASGAWSTHGPIARRWLNLGGPGSSLGFPTSNAIPISGGAQQHFLHGLITWTKKHGYDVSHH